MSDQTVAYRDNYNTMEKTLRELESMDVPDVDAVIPLMEKFNAAYMQNIARIDQVESLRNQMMVQKNQGE